MRPKDFRIHQEERIVKNRKRLMKVIPGESRDLPAGRLVKKHPFDCGHAKCGLCSIHKVDRKTRRKHRDAERKIPEE